jgi:hypothetical protein
MTNPRNTPSATPSESRMPAPRAIFRIMNPLMKMMLLSPLHGRMSKRLMVLTFTGRKTGKRYSTPVGYVRSGSGSILVFTHSLWRANFRQPVPVTMRIQGKDVQGIGQLVTDPGKIKQMVRELMTANGEEMSRRMNLWVDDVVNADPQEVLRATQGTYYIEIKVNQ